MLAALELVQNPGAAGAEHAASEANVPGARVTIQARPGEDGRVPEWFGFGQPLWEMWSGCRVAAGWTRQDLLRLFWVSCFIALCSWASSVLAGESQGVSTIWLPNGILLGLLITQSPRRWLPYLVAGVIGDTLGDVAHGDLWRVSTGISLANSMEVVISAVLLARLFGAPVNLSKRRPMAGFLLIAVGASAVASSLGTRWLHLFYPSDSFWQVFRSWWLGDLLGLIILVPLTYLLQRASAHTLVRSNQLGSTLLVLLAPVAATALIFSHNSDPLIFLLFPVLLLVAFRLGFSGTAVTIVMVSVLVLGFTVKGHGPLMLITGAQAIRHRILVAQVFVSVSILTMFPVAALLEEREALKQSLAASEARQRRLAETDELTGLANRRAFNLRLTAGWETARLEKGWMGLLLIDADHFKQYNDCFGHLAGDTCLQRLAEILQRVAAEPALAARYGGEEFAVLLPETDAGTVQAVAEAIREAVLAESMPHPTAPCGLQTISVGAAVVRPEDGQRAEFLVKRADEALYCAKLGGRNQVVALM